ncbi:carboxymuconolactone decarboxylase family protein [Micromonospora sp. DT81.3]|uniref:carboxymuconolactone decarboxylase family protein n=1 Tax=Micromonospora sp. DT81.3 TaxID=3416523 RepID=UPI003CECCB44
MRLPEVERGDTVAHRLLIKMISLFAGYRLPDAARVAFYDQEFVGRALGAWTQRAMRGPSGWSVSERELMAAVVASWNTCPFCVGAHSAIAVKGMDDAVVAAVLADYRTAPISSRLRAALVFVEKMTTKPEDVSAFDARSALDAGLTRDDLEDAAAVAALFNIIARNANALNFEIP